MTSIGKKVWGRRQSFNLWYDLGVLKEKENFLVLLLLAVAIYGAYQYAQLSRRSLVLQRSLATTEQSLSLAQAQNSELVARLTVEKARNDDFSETVNTIATSVNQLEKLKKLDPELLKKYSKVYFLNENYLPTKLTDIPTGDLFDKNKPQKILTNVWPYFNRLLESAQDDGVALQVISAYRSFATQAALKTNYKMVYGSGANQFSSDQGYSEHQLGTTVDLATDSATAASAAFEKTAAYTWLSANGYKYGFILSYPRGNAYYQFEPWHWRFVGVALATKLHKEGIAFYDLDQRVIDSFLITIFD